MPDLVGGLPIATSVRDLLAHSSSKCTSDRGRQLAEVRHRLERSALDLRESRSPRAGALPRACGTLAAGLDAVGIQDETEEQHERSGDANHASSYAETVRVHRSILSKHHLVYYTRVQIDQAVPRTTTKAETAQRIDHAAQRMVDAFERHAEFKVAYDRIGHKPYWESRRQLVKALLDFGREIVRAVLVTGRG